MLCWPETNETDIYIDFDSLILPHTDFFFLICAMAIYTDLKDDCKKNIELMILYTKCRGKDFKNHFLNYQF